MRRLALILALCCCTSAAWAATPTLAQRVAYGSLFNGQTMISKSFTLPLPNKVGSGNCIVLLTDYDRTTSVSSITDDAGNTWSSTPAVSADDTTDSSIKTEAYVLANANSSGARSITVNYAARIGTAHFIVMEYYNCATSSVVGVTTSSISLAPSSGVVTSTALTPTSGNLVVHYAMQDDNVFGQAGTTSVSVWTAASGWAMEAAEYASGNSGGPVFISPYGLETRTAPGGSITPSITTTQTTSHYNTITFELVGATAGTAPAAGIHVKRVQYFTNSNINVATWNEPFPCSGNLLAVTDIQGDIQAAITDSNSNTWTLAVAGVSNSVLSLSYAKAVTCSSTEVLHLPMTGTGLNTSVVVYDIEGADPNPFVQSQSVVSASEAGDFSGQAIITPTNANGLVIDAVAIGIGPLTGLTAPSGAYFLSILYPGESDFDSFNNADGYAINYYGSNLAQQNYSWNFAIAPARDVGTPVTGTGVASITPNPPANIETTDVVIAYFVFQQGSGVTITPPAGWTLINRTNSTTSLGVAAYWATGNATFGAYTISGLTGSIRANTMSMLHVCNSFATCGGGGVTNPLDVAAVSQSNASGTTITAPSITTANVFSDVFTIFGIASASTFSGGWATDEDHGTVGTIAVDVEDAVQNAAGASGTKTVTASSAAVSVGVTIALRHDQQSAYSVAVEFKAAAAGASTCTRTLMGVGC